MNSWLIVSPKTMHKCITQLSKQRVSQKASCSLNAAKTALSTTATPFPSSPPKTTHLHQLPQTALPTLPNSISQGQSPSMAVIETVKEAVGLSDHHSSSSSSSPAREFPFPPSLSPSLRFHSRLLNRAPRAQSQPPKAAVQ